jgi:hypothetical protein
LVAILVVVLAGRVAHADLKGDVEKLVHANIKAVAADKFDAFDRTVSGGRVLVLPSGKSAVESKSLVADIYGPGAKKVAHKVESLHVVVDAAKKMARFHGAIAAIRRRQANRAADANRGIAADERAGRLEDPGPDVRAKMATRSCSRTHRSNPRGEDFGVSAAKLVAGWFGEALDLGRAIEERRGRGQRHGRRRDRNRRIRRQAREGVGELEAVGDEYRGDAVREQRARVRARRRHAARRQAGGEGRARRDPREGEQRLALGLDQLHPGRIVISTPASRSRSAAS